MGWDPSAPSDTTVRLIDCPTCGGWGGIEVDDYNHSLEHITREVRCPTCKGEGCVEEEERHAD